MSLSENSFFINSPSVQFHTDNIKRAGKMLLLLIATILCRMASRHNIHIHFSIHFLTKIVICSCPFLYFFRPIERAVGGGLAEQCWLADGVGFCGLRLLEGGGGER